MILTRTAKMELERMLGLVGAQTMERRGVKYSDVDDDSDREV